MVIYQHKNTYFKTRHYIDKGIIKILSAKLVEKILRSLFFCCNINWLGMSGMTQGAPLDRTDRFRASLFSVWDHLEGECFFLLE